MKDGAIKKRGGNSSSVYFRPYCGRGAGSFLRVQRVLPHS
jgi:hypothetical protein